jgi:Leu/Phe-tRNA-protein transferase
MVKNYAVWKNGYLAHRMNDTFETVVEFCDKFSEKNPGDWVEITEQGNNSQTLYKRCAEMQIREVK